jgi:hypothetical protein
MATAPHIALGSELCLQRKLIEKQTNQIERLQKVLDIQFRRIADIQAELDLVKATVRLATPSLDAVLIGPQPVLVAMS